MVDITEKGLDDFLRDVPWKPQPLRREIEPLEYPVESLPPLVANAVREVEAYMQAPVVMVAACALSVVSAAVQSRFDVRRDPVLTGPVSLYFLTVAESGERKTAVDKLFMAPLREWQAQQVLAAREAKKLYEAQLEAWKKEGEELRKQQPQASPFNPEQPSVEGEAPAGEVGVELDPLTVHAMQKPIEPRTARILRGDDTTEALLMALQEYPIAVVISAEAGVIFGSHSMGNETVQRNLATVNAIWDGGPISQDRVGRELIDIERCRATFGLLLQPAALQHFVKRTDGLARGIGYFARFLFSHPATTQGTRFYTDPPAEMPALGAFCARVTALLDQPPQFDLLGRLDPDLVALDPLARDIWIGFHDEVEEQLGGDGYFSRIKDVASKAPENAARLACCFHTFMTDGGPIRQLTMINACSVMRWYLDEAVRFGQVADVTEEVRNAELLEGWLTQQVRLNKALQLSGITVNTVRQKGPNALRVRQKLDAALELLEDHGRIRVNQAYGTKRRYITIAPQVLKEWS